MYTGANSFFMRSNVVTAMSRSNSAVKELLDGLSLKELKVIRQHPDLMKRIEEIAKTSIPHLFEALREDYSLEVEHCLTGDVLIDPEEIVSKAVPEGVTKCAGGWWLNTESGEFTTWAREFLMQEVRIEIWFRYLQHKDQDKKRQELVARSVDAQVEMWGQYGFAGI